MIRKIEGLLLAGFLAIGLGACGSTAEEEVSVIETAAASEITESASADAETQTEDETEDSESHILVAYFSATGTTREVAEILTSVVSADVYEIVPVDTYTEEDLNYNDASSRATTEQNDSTIRPEISGTIENWDAYDVVFIGYPIWWGQEPRIMDTFVESYDFEGKTVIPFCTSGSSGIAASESNLEELANGGTWLEGERFASGASVTEVSDWISDLGIDIQ